MLKRICILSMQRVDNFGSLLQSYSLKKMIENFGYDVKFVDIKSNEFERKLLIVEEDYTKETQLHVPKYKKIDKYLINRLRNKKIYNKQIALFEEFRKEVLMINRECNNLFYDTCVIGSDEVFNCTFPGEWGFTTQLFGNVENAKKVITYAASCGPATYDKINDEMKKLISKSLKNISSISVRDNNTFNFVNQMMGNNVNINYNLDPVLVGNFDDELVNNSNIKLPSKFCIVYSYYNRIKSKKEISKIINFCKKNNMKIISVGAPQFWIKNHLVLTPFEMLYVFSKADFVITDTFHGTIFGAKFSKNFATIIRNSNNNKLLDLINRLGLTSHLCDDALNFENIYNIGIKDKNKFNELILKERNSTIEYLKGNL